MPKFYVFSDCHGFYDELVSALDQAGFDKNNPEHFLIGLGDYWDRGEKPYEVSTFLNKIENKILVMGNHELLIKDAIERKYPLWNDFPNGTHDTVFQINNKISENTDIFSVACNNIASFVDKWISPMPYYFETRNYVFVHSFVPLKYFNSDWRYAPSKEWEKAMWGNPFELSELLQEKKDKWTNAFGNLNKKIVFGHFHASFGWHNYSHKCSEFEDDAIFTPYYGKRYIGIDACTAHTKKVNVIVLEDNFLT